MTWTSVEATSMEGRSLRCAGLRLISCVRVRPLSHRSAPKNPSDPARREKFKITWGSSPSNNARLKWSYVDW